MEVRNPRESASNELPALEPTLILGFTAHGKDGSQRHLIPREGLALGRDAAIFTHSFEDLRMSLHHAEIRIVGERVLIHDLNSESGTRLNGESLSGERELKPGDVLRLGDTLLVFARSAKSAPQEEPELIGSSAAMAGVQRSINAVATRKHTVVITGETGTGKEVVAQLLHQRSNRPGPFLAVNCGVFTESLLASDLFGHVRGAFTGAITEQQGLFRAASKGTLVLDEVAEIPLVLQSTLLRVLETHEVRPVGGSRNVSTDVRVIATSNRDLIDLVRAGSFRSDLYSRLAQWTIRLPPLRERREDIPALTTHLLGRCDGLGRKLTPDLAEALLLHDWPLNVRGLFNVLAIAVISSPEEGPLLLGEEVSFAMETSRILVASELDVETEILDEAALRALMERFQGKVATAARHIGVGRPRLYRMLWTFGIEPAPFRAGKKPV